MKLGVIISTRHNLREKFKELSEMGFSVCQLSCWNPEFFTDENAEIINKAKEEYGIEIPAFWCGWSGPAIWNSYDGHVTLGLVPEAYRHKRFEELKKGADFAEKIGVKNVVTHVGFIPENPMSYEYNSLVSLLRCLANYLKEKGQNFLFETGQETPVTLRRTIEDIGTDNLGINLDPANLILYGKANAVDSLDVFGEFVMSVHGKDAIYPKDGKNLGEEKRIGDGKVNFPALIKRLKELGYDGPIIIEREISGEKQIEDILYAKKFLENLIQEEENEN